MQADALTASTALVAFASPRRQDLPQDAMPSIAASLGARGTSRTGGRTTCRHEPAGQRQKGRETIDCFGRPRGRMVERRSNCRTTSSTQWGAPKGRPRCADARSVSSSPAASGRLTNCSQSSGRASGQSESSSSPCPHSRRHRLPQCHSCAPETRPARTGLRSTSGTPSADAGRPGPEMTCTGPGRGASTSAAVPRVPLLGVGQRQPGDETAERAAPTSGHNTRCQWFGIRQ